MISWIFLAASTASFYIFAKIVCEIYYGRIIFFDSLVGMLLMIDLFTIIIHNAW